MATGTRPPPSGRPGDRHRLLAMTSDAAPPVFAEALDIAKQPDVVAAPAFVLRQFDRAHRLVVQALAFGRKLFGRVGHIHHVLPMRSYIVLGTQPSAGSWVSRH